MPIPNQDKIVDYLETTKDLPITEASPFRTNFMTSREARKKTRENLTELEKITGSKMNIVI